MIDEIDIELFGSASPAESARFRSFLRTHREKRITLDGKAIPYLACGTGKTTILTFAGGWGGVDLAYDLVLSFEDRFRVIVADISAFDDPDEMTRGVDRVLDEEKAGEAVVIGQSLSGIISQSFFKREFRRVKGLVLTNTLAPRKERSKKWVLALLRVLPFGPLRKLARKKLTRLSHVEAEIPDEVRRRREFVAGLLGRMTEVYWTKGILLNVLRLAFAFNERDGYTRDSFPGWPGKALIVTSEDDPGYPDAELLAANLPRSEIFKFPKGFGHLAPQIHRDEYHRLVREFIDRLDAPAA